MISSGRDRCASSPRSLGCLTLASGNTASKQMFPCLTADIGRALPLVNTYSKPTFAIRNKRHIYWRSEPEDVLAEPEPREPVFDEPMVAVEARVRKMIKKVTSTRSLDA